jgi:hypothetical protein
LAEIGILAVGPKACALRLKHLELPVHRVCADPIVPLEDDMPTLVRESAAGLFDGPDADRWQLVPARSLADRTAMLWAASQASSADVQSVTDGWDSVLVIAWAESAALLHVVRMLGDKPLTVLLGGRLRADDPAVRRNHVVLADLLRTGRVTSVIHVPEPDSVLAVAADAARDPVVQDFPRRKAVDIGTSLGIGPAWAIPAQPVPIQRLVHVPLGRATQLPQLIVDIAAFQSLKHVFNGPPVDVEGVSVRDLDALRARLPQDPEAVFKSFRERLLNPLDSVEFVGEEPLVDQITQVLRPIAADVRTTVQIVDEIESNRILRLKAFGAAGVGYTAQRLRAQLDDLGDQDARWRQVDLVALVDGDLEPLGPGVSLLSWRRAFAGVPSYIVRRNSPGWAVAREMVKDRFAAFKSEFATSVAQAMEARVRAAVDPGSPLPRQVVQSLYERAVNIRDALTEVLVTLNGRVLAGCEIALRQDGLLRWVEPEPEKLRSRLESLTHRTAVMAELERAATVALTRRPLGMANAVDFESYRIELVDGMQGLSRAASATPTYADVLTALLEREDPEGLRTHLTDARGMDPVLSLQRNTPKALMSWFQRTGMQIEVRSAEPCAIYWAEADDLSSPLGENQRIGTDEHLLSDLVLPPPEGDTAQSLAAFAEATVVLITALVVGELTASGEEGVRALQVRGGGLPPLSILPYGAIHDLAVQPGLRADLAARVHLRLDTLARAPDSGEALLKLVELSALGPSARVSAQLGLDHPRFQHLLPAIGTMMERNARRAVVAMLDHMRVEEVAALSDPPTRHAIVDVLQLSPLGVG